MSDPSLTDPRANQKARTRASIVEAAGKLIGAGKAPSVAEAAEAAKVSRATAYRYFPTPEALHMEVAGITPAFEPVEQLVQALEGEDAPARLAAFTEAFNRVTFAEEARMRIALKTYVDIWFASKGDEGEAPAVREGRRMRWLDEVLAPARPALPEPQWQRLKAALALTSGADAMVVMKDVCRLGEEEAQAVLQWTARALLQAALGEAREP
jgi:AcrR family transcriptional regulator